VTIAETTTVASGLDQWLRAIEASASGSVEVAETELSWVFLTDRHAYKIKKPIDFGEAQYRLAARRRLACLKSCGSIGDWPTECIWELPQ
jgi:hypothetical protein